MSAYILWWQLFLFEVIIILNFIYIAKPVLNTVFNSMLRTDDNDLLAREDDLGFHVFLLHHELLQTSTCSRKTLLAQFFN